MSAAQRLTWILFLGLAAGMAHAAAYDVNGVRLGMTQEEVQALFGDKIECAARPPSDTDPSQASCVSAKFSKDKVLVDTFAGQKTVIRYQILDGRVARITFLGFPSMAFDNMVHAMEATYGKAKVVNQDIRVGIKSELVNKRAIWGSEGGDMIVFDKYSAGNLERSYLNFYSNAYPKALRPAAVD
jgi:hypothetical protein